MIYQDVVKIVGGQVPDGTVTVSGAKNSATRLLAAATLSDEIITLMNYPVTLVDSSHKVRFLEANGAKIECSEKTITIDCSSYSSNELKDYFFPIRTTYLLVAGQLKRDGRAYIPYPGGCNIGDRKYDVHVMVWETFGCCVDEKNDHILVQAPSRLCGSLVEFPISTVGGTENALLMASIADGESEIVNAYITPEVQDLIDFLCTMGVEITVAGNSHIRVIGRSEFKSVRYSVMPDRIEALTWIVYGVHSGGEIMVENVPFSSMEIPLMHLRDAGVDFYSNSRSVYVSKSCLAEGGIHSFEVACGTHPGIISDMQPFYVMLGLAATGKSRIHDFRYPGRIAYVEELKKFCGNNVQAERGLITVQGPSAFHSADAMATDLRGTMAALLAALCCTTGTSTIKGISMALRGYDDLLGKLESLGVIVSLESN